MSRPFMKALPMLAGMVATATVTSPETAHAYSCVASNCARHCDDPVPYFLGAASDDLGEVDSERFVQQAMNAWSSRACTGLRLQYLGRTTTTPNRGNAVIAWDENTWAHGTTTIGVTTSVSGGSCLRASMRLNGVDFTWIAGRPAAGRQVNAFSILAHEGGHYLGLGHSTAPNAMMAARYSGNILMITDDDEQGICRLYPGDGGALPMPTEPDAGMPDSGHEPAPTDASAPEPDAGEPAPEPVPEPSPPQAEIGQPCQANDDCSSNLCLDLGSRTLCSRPCVNDSECDPGFACASEGDLGVCLPRENNEPGPAARVGQGTVTGGCAIGHTGGHPGRSWLLMSLVALASAFRLWRRGRDKGR